MDFILTAMSAICTVSNSVLYCIHCSLIVTYSRATLFYVHQRKSSVYAHYSTMQSMNDCVAWAQLLWRKSHSHSFYTDIYKFLFLLHLKCVNFTHFFIFFFLSLFLYNIYLSIYLCLMTRMKK